MVSIIILSYNTKELLRICLNSIKNHLKGLEIEIVVIDNDSKDESIKMLKKDFQNVITIKNSKNLGFTKANNLGAKAAKGDYLLFLNSDTKFLDDSIRGAIELMDQNENIGILGASLQNKDGSYQKSYGKFYNLYNLFLMLFGLERKNFKKNTLINVDWVTGAFFLIRKKLFDKLGGFDENLFMYTEDMELCYRVKELAFQVCFDSKLKIEHLGQGSSDRKFAIVNIYKGILYFYKKHKSYPEYLIAKLLLNVKANSAMFIGLISKNNALYSTYKEALKF